MVGFAHEPSTSRWSANGPISEPFDSFVTIVRVWIGHPSPEALSTPYFAKALRSPIGAQ